MKSELSPKVAETMLGAPKQPAAKATGKGIENKPEKIDAPKSLTLNMNTGYGMQKPIPLGQVPAPQPIVIQNFPPPAQAQPAIAVATEKTEFESNTPRQAVKGQPNQAGLTAVMLVLFLLVFGVIFWNPLSKMVTGSSSSSTPDSSEVEALKQQLAQKEQMIASYDQNRKMVDEVIGLDPLPNELPSLEPTVEKPAEIRYLKAVKLAEKPAQCPKVVKWVKNGDYLIPVRQMPDGFAGYGSTYEDPPNGGGIKPTFAWAQSVLTSGKGWVRNERGDWAIPLQN